VFPRAKVAVFVDGCFWHGCPDHYRAPVRNHEYWAAKIEKNQHRDQVVDATLHNAGWAVVRVWEHEDPRCVAERVAQVVRSRTRRPDHRPIRVSSPTSDHLSGSGW
jgi:DNA mismatch endonuclease (patch repair protein)